MIKAMIECDMCKKVYSAKADGFYKTTVKVSKYIAGIRKTIIDGTDKDYCSLDCLMKARVNGNLRLTSNETIGD